MSADSHCYVCKRPIVDELPHTHHAEGCPWRNPSDDGDPNTPCEGLEGCGEDVHPDCCPTCQWDDRMLSD